jgi:hypothetical protein
LKIAIIAFAFACSAAFAAQAAGQSAQYPAFPDAARAGFGTNAKVALLWHWSEGVVRSVGVTKVVRDGKGVICVLPKVALNPKGIYPIVAVAPDESNAIAAFAGARNEGELCPSAKYIEVDTFQASGNSANPSNNVGFFLTIQ